MALALLLLAAVCSAGQDRELLRVEVLFETVRRLPVIHASVAGKSGAFVLDTGSEGTLVDRKFLGLKKAGDGAALGSGGIMGAPSNVGEFCISAHCIGKTQVWLIDFDGYSEKMGRRIDGIIGQDVLSQFDEVTINYKKSTVTFSILVK